MLRTLLVLMLTVSSMYAQENLRAPVVVLDAESITGGREMGTAFLVGQREGRLYFLTAWHVVEYAPEAVQITFRSGQQTTGRVENHNSGLDAALISCPAPAAYRPPPSFALATSDPASMQAVRIVGHPDGNRWDVNVRSSIKDAEIDFDARFFSLNPDGIRPGSSGSPVLGQDRRLLGMVQEEGAVMARALSHNTLLRLLQNWNAPTDLMVGVPDEIGTGGISETEMQYRLAMQEASYAYANGAWKQAREAYQRAHGIKPTSELSNKIRECTAEVSRDSLYLRYLDRATLTSDPQAALKLLEQAQAQRNTGEIQRLIEDKKRLIATVVKPKSDNSPQPGSTTGATPTGTYTDPHAGTMVRIPGGSFTMGSEDGSSNEKPAHRVTVKDFYIGKYEVTQAQWQAIMGNNPSNFKNCDQCPVESVSWEDVQQFIQKLNAKTGQRYRLPTEAEWEYAAGGGAGNRTKWAGTNSESSLGNYAWYTSNSSSKTHPKGEKSPNALGLYDMSGNVWEWCQDWYHSSYTGAPTDGSAWESPAGSSRVVRGGGWVSLPADCRVADRNYGSPGYRSNLLGFRLARTP